MSITSRALADQKSEKFKNACYDACAAATSRLVGAGVDIGVQLIGVAIDELEKKRLAGHEDV